VLGLPQQCDDGSAESRRRPSGIAVVVTAARIRGRLDAFVAAVTGVGRD
jgi:hypothetical protein